jgi:uncharacterized membrane protein YdjX (TVP38/TMEM64 family)
LNAVAKTGDSSIQRQILFASAIIAVVGLIAASDALHSRTQELVVAIEAMIADYPLLGMSTFVLLALASAMLAFFSSAILVPVGIYAWGAPVCFLLLWLGWFLGGIASFAVGRLVGQIIVERIIGEERLRRLEARVRNDTRFVHIVLFQAMLPSEIPGYVLGSMRYRFVPFAIALSLVEMPYALGTIYIGDSFLEGRGWLLVALAAGGGLAALAAFAIYRRRRLNIASVSQTT